MAQVIKHKYAVNVAATRLVVSDISGANVPPNVTGWGAPNLELNETAIWAIVKRKASTGDQYMVPVASQIVYDAGALNDKVTEIEFIFNNDGVLEVTMGALRASVNGVSFIDATPIPDGTFFYWVSGGNVLWQMVAGVPVAVLDINVLLANASTVLQTTTADILLPRLAVKKQELYKKYRISRDTECDDAEPLFNELLKLSQDIQGAIYAFYSGLTIEAQDQVETMLDRYGIVNI